MRLLHETDREALMLYVRDEAAYNIFIIGDVENYGLENENVSVAVKDNNGIWDSMVLRYHDNFVVYAKNEEYDAAAVAQYIKELPYDTISGKGSIVSKLIPFFPHRRARMTFLSRCDSLSMLDLWPHDFVIRRIQPQETNKVVGLYCVIDAFKQQYLGRESVHADTMACELQRGGMGYGAFVGDEIVSYAQITARNSQSAMVVGVCTHPNYEHRGLASAVMQSLCQASFDSGLTYLCLFYDNPKAGRIYRRIGFEETGEYMLLSRREEEA